MSEKRQVEIFSAGCPLCRQTEQMLRQMACDDCQITVRDMNDPQTAARAKELGITRVPTVVIDGKPAPCCQQTGPDPRILRAAGLGQPL